MSSEFYRRQKGEQWRSNKKGADLQISLSGAVEMLSQTYFQQHEDAPPADRRIDPHDLKEALPRTERVPRLLACIKEANSASSVVGHAAVIARSLGLEMQIAKVIEDDHVFGSPIDPIEWKLRTQEHTRYLQDLARKVDLDSETAGILLHGDPPSEIIDWSKANGCTLLALATRSGANTFGLGPTVLRVLEHGLASLLLIPSDTIETPSYRRVLVPIDGSPRADSVIPIAGRIARANGSELILAHVLPRAQRHSGFAPSSTLDLQAQIERENAVRAREHLQQLRMRASELGANVRSVVLDPADPRHATCEFATRHDVDLVVMSSHGATALNDVPCGSVAEYLASHCTMPVLMVRPNLVAGFGSDVFGQDGQSVFRFG